MPSVPPAPTIPQPTQPIVGVPPVTTPPAICQPCAPLDREKLKDEIIKEVIAQIPKPRDGADGKDGRDGSDGHVTQSHIDTIIAAVSAKIPPQLPTRVVIADGKNKRIIEDETYAPGEPIVIDFERVISEATRQRGINATKQ
jgi:hypothetical protein